MVMNDHDHVELEQELLEVKPVVAADEEEDVHIDKQVQVLVLVQDDHDCNHDRDHGHELAEVGGELPVAEPNEQEDFDTEEGEEQVQIQVQVQVQRIQSVGQSVGASGCLESVGHVPSVERPPEPHAIQRYLEGSGP